MRETVLNQRYRLLDKIGEGGMAEVFRAEDTLLERTVAVKLLREQYAADPDFLARFQQEARSAAKVAHPNIVSVYDVGSDGRANYIVMEYVEGPNLKTLIREGAPLGVARSVDVAVQMLTALNFAHQKGLIHRDVKPQNILIGADGQVKVADFGIARAANTPQLTTTGVVLATVQYCSPEQAMGKVATAASDIYSVGVVLYEMLTGNLPFEADSPVAVALKHLQETPRPPRELNPAIPRRLESIILQALAKEPERRFQTAADMRQALRTYQQFGEEATATFHPIAPGAGAGPGSAASASGSTAPARSRPARSGGVDWLAVALGLLVFVLVAGAVPLALQVYKLYFEPQIGPEPTQVPVTTQVAPTYTPTPPPTPTPEPPTPTPLPPTPTAVPQIAVPRLVGKPYEQVRQELDDMGLKVRIARESFSSLFDPMVVIDQSPPPDTPVPPDTMVEVTVSRGAEKVLVESVVGSSPAEARSKLEAAGFLVDTTDQWDSRVPPGVVAAQRPEAGEVLPRGSLVTLVVSKGPEPTPTIFRPPEGNDAWVPNVIGKSEAEARRLIELAGLKNDPYATYQVESDVPESARAFFRQTPVGAVLSTDPPPGQRVVRNTTVKIAVRKQ